LSSASLIISDSCNWLLGKVQNESLTDDSFYLSRSAAVGKPIFVTICLAGSLLIIAVYRVGVRVRVRDRNGVDKFSTF